MYYTGFFHGASTGDKIFLNVSLSTGVIENFLFPLGEKWMKLLIHTSWNLH